MSLATCTQVEPLLVEFADGELEPRESATVAAHLTQCEHCRQTLTALQRSLALTRELWRANETSLAGLASGRRLRPARLRRRVPALAAAAVLLAVGISSFWPASPPPDRDSTLTAGPSVIEQQQMLDRTQAAARLLAAADCLAEQPGGLEIAVERYHYIIATYPQTEAASAAAARVRAHQERRI